MEFFMENMTRKAQGTIGNIPQIAEDTSNTLGKAVASLVDNLAPIMDKLAGTESNLKLSFDDLTLDTGTAKAKISGSINFEVAYSEQTQVKAKPVEGETKSGDSNQVDRTEVTNVT
jgi:hypothetical protein